MASTNHTPPYIVIPTENHTHTIILLHGTSTTGPSFASTFLTFPIPYPTDPQTAPATQNLSSLLPTTKLIFPTGLLNPSTVFNGELKNAWFDISSFADRTLNENLQISGLRESSQYLSTLVAAESGLIGAENVFVGGFSQGSAMSMFFLLSGYLTKKIGGVAGMSGWLPFRKQIEESTDVGGFMKDLVGGGALDDGLKQIPVWMGQGKLDTKVLEVWAEQMRDVLRQNSFDVQYSAYEGLDHWYGEQEMVDFLGFLKENGVCVGPAS